MSELITAANIDLMVKKNNEIKDEVLEQAMKLQMNPSIMKVASRPQLALLILQGFGLIQMPIEDKFWSGAIFAKDGKIIPVLNTALPRAPVPVSYKSNDAILCQLFREGKIGAENIREYRKDIRKITYSKVQEDHSVILVTEVIDNDMFSELIQDRSVHIIF